MIADGNVAFKVTWVYGNHGPFSSPCTPPGRLPRPEGRILHFIGPDIKRYGSTPPSNDVWKGFMQFGVHAIKVEAFIEQIWKSAGLTTVE